VNKLFAAVLALALFTVVTDAQKKAPPKSGSASLEVAGARLHLGMTKADVIGKLAGSQITRINEDNWIVVPTDGSVNGRFLCRNRGQPNE
jgi:hypothetical protein